MKEISMRDQIIHHGEDASERHPGVTVSIETITPEYAKWILDNCNTHNRRITSDQKRDERNQIFLDMKNGRFAFNGESITFSPEGTLLDGQHRLNACVRAGKPFDTVVVRGVRMASQMTMDKGAKRTVANNLQIMGCSNANILGGAGKLICMWATNGWDVPRNSVKSGFTDQDVQEFCLSHEDELQQAISTSGSSSHSGKRVLSASRATALAFVFSRISAEDAAYFFDDFNSPVPERQPIALLKDKLYKDAVGGRRSDARTVIAYVVKAWNAFMEGERLLVLRFAQGGARPEKFPVPDGYYDGILDD